MDRTYDERDLNLAGLFELVIARADNEGLRDRARVLAVKLGGDADVMFFERHPCMR